MRDWCGIDSSLVRRFFRREKENLLASIMKLAPAPAFIFTKKIVANYR